MTESEQKVPTWASFFASAARYRTFIGSVERAMQRRGLRVRVDESAGVVLVTGEAGGFGLENLAQRCSADREESSWDALIESHLDQALQGEADRAALPVDDFDKVKSLLRVKLYDATLAPAGLLVGHALADDLFAALVYDLPTSVAPVSSAEVRGWGRTVDELFHIGLSNVWESGPLEGRVLEADGVHITRIGGPSFFAATHLLVADKYVSQNPKYGLLVACPTRHMVLIHAIGEGPLTVAMRKMSNATHGVHSDGPGSITASLYWWRDGNFERLQIERRGDASQLTPSPAFEALLAELSGTSKHAPQEEAPDDEALDEDAPVEVTETASRVQALLAETLPIAGRRTALAVDVDRSTKLTSKGFVCPLKLFVNGGRDPAVATDIFDHPTFVLFPRRTMADTARCEAALRSALERIAIEIGLAKVPLPSFDDSEKFFSALFPFSILDSALEPAAQDAAIKGEIKKVFTTVKL